jgi:hypothetical protein
MRTGVWLQTAPQRRRERVLADIPQRLGDQEQERLAIPTSQPVE